MSSTPIRFTSSALVPRVPFDKGAGWTLESVWTIWNREKVSCPQRESNHHSSVVQCVDGVVGVVSVVNICLASRMFVLLTVSQNFFCGNA
jgi:hypothetical protein